MLRRGSPARRLNISLLCIVFVLTLFVGRLVQLQGFDSPRYQNLAERLRLSPESIPAVRGSITTSDGRVLAMTVQTDLVFADPAQIPRRQAAGRGQRAGRAARHDAGRACWRCSCTRPRRSMSS